MATGGMQLQLHMRVVKCGRSLIDGQRQMETCRVSAARDHHLQLVHHAFTDTATSAATAGEFSQDLDILGINLGFREF